MKSVLAKRVGVSLATGVAASILATACSHAPVERAPAEFLALGSRACSEGHHPSLEDRAEQVRMLRDTMERSLVQTAPNGTYPPGSPADRVFNGNYDWHSSVHDHWALLSMARVTRDAALERRLLARLTPAVLAAEGARLAREPAEPHNEMPYGQSWLLLLLSELERHPGGATPEEAALRAATQERVIRHLESSPFPEGRKGAWFRAADPAYFSRAHSSWLFSYWLLKLSRPKAATPAMAERLSRLALKAQAQRDQLLRQTQGSPRDFLYLPAMLWLVDHAEPVGTRWPYAADEVAFPELPVTMHNAHQSGAVMVSVWPYALQSGLGDRASCEKFNALLDRMLMHSEYWRYEADEIGTFSSVGHWVPQFIWMAILLEQGQW